MNAELSKKVKNDFQKDFNLMNNPVFWKTKENVRKHRDIKLVTTERRRNYLVSEPSYPTPKFFTENPLAIEIKKKKDTYELTCLFKTFNTEIKWNINVWVLEQLFKTKIWWKN